MRPPPKMTTSGVTAFVAACALARGAGAQDSAEPIGLAYQAPLGCPEADAFFREITARTTRVSLAKQGEAARTLHVVVARRGIVFAGRLWFEETAAQSSAREVTDTTCGEVVGALGLVAALAVDPRASTAPVSAPVAAPPSTVVAPAPTGTAQAGSTREPPKTGSVRARLGIELQPPARAAPLRFAAGAQIELVTVAGAVFAGRMFVDLEAGDPGAVWSPSFRLALGRSLDIEKRASVGGATLRFTQASLEVCPLTVAIASSFAMRPCAGVSAGVLEAQGKDVFAARAQTRPWVTTSAHARLEWEPLRRLALDVDLGALAPLYRDSFFFNPNVPIYQAPPFGFVGRMGVCVLFP
jgi:hypothetical protein